jgi:D-alanine transaminase
MSRIAYVNGRYLPQARACVNIEDRGYQFGDGVYEVIQVFRRRFVDAGPHMDRLERSLREISLTPPMARPALLHVLGEVVRRNRIDEGIVYLQVTRGVARREHATPRGAVPPALVVTARRIAPYPASADDWTLAAITRPDERWRRCDIKSVGLLPNVLAKTAARDAGAGEAILFDADGQVTEGASTTVWIVDAAGVLRTRPLDHAVLPGCTRQALADLLREEGIDFAERGFSLAELRAAREAFLTSATSFVKPVVRIDGAPVAEGQVGPVTRRLFALFARHVRDGA